MTGRSALMRADEELTALRQAFCGAIHLRLAAFAQYVSDLL